MSCQLLYQYGQYTVLYVYKTHIINAMFPLDNLIALHIGEETVEIKANIIIWA